MSDSTWREKHAKEEYDAVKDKYWALRDATDVRLRGKRDSARLLADQPADIQELLADLDQRGDHHYSSVNTSSVRLDAVPPIWPA